MSDIEVIRETVASTARRRRWQNAWNGFWLGLFTGACLWLFSVALHKALPLPDAALLIAGLCALSLLPAGFLSGRLKRLSLAETARWIDAQERFQERLGTALELANDHRTGNWPNLVLADAARHARRFDPRVALPYRLPPTWRWSMLALMLAAGLGFVPEHRTERHRQMRAETAIMQDTGRHLDQLIRRELQHHPPALESTRQALADVQNLAAQLSQATLTREDALLELASVTDRIRDALRDAERNPGLRRLDEAAHRSGEHSIRSPSGPEPQIQSLQQPNGQQAGDPDSFDRIDPVKRDPDTPTPDIAQRIEMTPPFHDAPPEHGMVHDSLAGNLKKGDGLAALQALEQMVEQLADPDLTREQLDHFIEEMRDAVASVADHGQIAEMLADAVRGFEQEDRTMAGQALDNTIQEMRQQFHQQRDSQGLMTALEGLQTAQMCIGNNKSWGLAQSELARFQAGSPTSRSTSPWVDDKQSPDRTGPTGIQDRPAVGRSDMDTPGLTDHLGDWMLDALSPAPVRGELGPGGTMPGISLRGLGLQGESHATYQEAIAAAQMEARSALSQQQVPWVYREVVRDYFDDVEQP